MGVQHTKTNKKLKMEYILYHHGTRSELSGFIQRRLPLISVAMVEGKALGGGAELTTACDFR